MGLLRMLLAFSVLTSHMHGRGIFGFRILYGGLAVECFFMISGFYMALVLNEKYNRPGNYISFLWQRLLRLFPAYLGILLLYLVVEGLLSLAAGRPRADYVPWFMYGSLLSLKTWATLIGSNLFLFGQQFLVFQAIDPATGELCFTGRYYADPIPAPAFIFIGPAWSLSLELAFYLIAPLLVRRPAWFQVLIVLGSVALRVGTSWMINPYENPWHMDHFFPYELAFFMAGSVGYQIYRHQKPLLERLTGFTSWFRWVFIAFAICYGRLPGPPYARESIFVPLLFLMIPILFYGTKNNATDRLIGELSYPFYLIHMLILVLMRPWVPHYFPQALEGPIYAVISVGSAYLVYRGIDEKVDRFRHRLFERETQAGLAPVPKGAALP
jgi:peptidoglycan/LPS O-acetylase OafA/YrhL